MREFKFTSRYTEMTITAATNDSGNGLWINGKQVEGTAQFTAPTDHTKARAKIRRYIARQYPNDF